MVSGFSVHTIPDSYRTKKFPLWRADSYAGYTGYVWVKAETAKKNLRVQKYPNTCGRGFDCPLNIPSFISALGKVSRGIPQNEILNAPANI